MLVLPFPSLVDLCPTEYCHSLCRFAWIIITSTSLICVYRPSYDSGHILRLIRIAHCGQICGCTFACDVLIFSFFLKSPIGQIVGARWDLDLQLPGIKS